MTVSTRRGVPPTEGPASKAGELRIDKVKLDLSQLLKTIEAVYKCEEAIASEDVVFIRLSAAPR